MKIESKFWEYYDIAAQYGVCLDTTFDRKTYNLCSFRVPIEDFYIRLSNYLLPRNFIVKGKRKFLKRNNGPTRHETLYSPYLLYLCGYSFLFYVKKEYPYGKEKEIVTMKQAYTEVSTCFYTLKNWETYFNRKERKVAEDSLNKTINECIAETERAMLFVSNITNVAYFSIELDYDSNKYIVTAYPVLSNLPGWVESRDPYLDFQMISCELRRIQYLNSPPLSSVETDIDKIERHGFDKKISFRSSKKPSTKI